MSWWDTGEDDDVTGDQPADLVRQALQRISEERDRRSQEKPALADLLRAIGIVANSPPTKEFADPPAELRQVVAELKSGESVASGPLRFDAGSGDLIGPLADGLHATAEVYQERWGRKPRIREWLKAFEFVLRYRPEDFLEDGKSHPPTKIRIE